PYDEDSWDYDPLGELKDDNVYGRGATDMKGSVAAMMGVARWFVETDTEPPVTLKFLFVSDEETGGNAGLKPILNQGLLKANACLIGEPTCEEGHHSVTAADRGSIWITLESTGKAAHGSRPVIGINAVDRLYDAVTDIRETVEDITLEIDPMIESFVEESIEYYKPIMGEEETRGLFYHPTVNLGVLRGGETINTVPDSATAKLDIRVTPGVHTPDILETVHGVVDKHERVRVSESSWSIGSYEKRDSEIVNKTRQTAEEVIGEKVHRRIATGGGDAKKVRNAGIPTVEFAFGTDTAHAVNEYIPKRALVANAKTYAVLPYALSPYR
ncbi:MAG: M20/M25/M40 family metallo-hydrolase, partial [Halobacteria archaeon]|nr:M20/M25/M40 family metallo-hydrolase [Halobacteria archaeon]